MSARLNKYLQCVLPCVYGLVYDHTLLWTTPPILVSCFFFPSGPQCPFLLLCCTTPFLSSLCVRFARACKRVCICVAPSIMRIYSKDMSKISVCGLSKYRLVPSVSVFSTVSHKHTHRVHMSVVVFYV